jgi:hypothetical protein
MHLSVAQLEKKNGSNFDRHLMRWVQQRDVGPQRIVDDPPRDRKYRLFHLKSSGVDGKILLQHFCFQMK